ncbi:hypothetical protein [Mesorhizobium sp. 1M-11]|uniref:hypothetical protein n=1 Tax=Mesorhizobium sp. 1M-11 TaxID=1529006 RepID=UPI0006C73C87|nr:hypothetical protein [Mesorhizobium sp. 1M-11]
MVTADEARRELARRELERAQQGSRPAPADDYASSWFAQLTSGANEGIAKTLGAPVDLTNNYIVGPAMHGINAIAGTNFQPSEEPLGGSAGLLRSLQDIGSIKPPTDDPDKQLGRRLSEGVASTLLTSMGGIAKAEAPIRETLKAIYSGLGSGAGGTLANYIAPDNPYAELLGQLVGGRVASGPFEMGRRAPRQVYEAVPELSRRQALLEAYYEKAGDLAPLSAPAAVGYTRRAVMGRPVMEGPPTKARPRNASGNRILDALRVGRPTAIAD